MTLSSELAQEALTDAYGTLYDRLDTASILGHLVSERILTEAEHETIRTRATIYDRNAELLVALKRKNVGEIISFCQILFSKKQVGCGEALLEALRKREIDISSIAVPTRNPPVTSPVPKFYPVLEDLDDSFLKLVREVRGIAGSIADLKTICIHLLSRTVSTKRDVQKDVDKLRESDDCISFLQPYWDSLDCQLLFRLIQQLDNSQLKNDWKKYKDQVAEACRTTLAECKRTIVSQPQPASNQAIMGFQTNSSPDDITIQKILDLKEFLVKVIGLEVAIFEGFSSSFVTLFFSIPRSQVPVLLHKFVSKRSTLRHFSITVVSVHGGFIYDVTTDDSFTYPEVLQLIEIGNFKEEMMVQFHTLQQSMASLKTDISRSEENRDMINILTDRLCESYLREALSLKKDTVITEIQKLLRILPKGSHPHQNMTIVLNNLSIERKSSHSEGDDHGDLPKWPMSWVRWYELKQEEPIMLLRKKIVAGTKSNSVFSSHTLSPGTVPNSHTLPTMPIPASSGSACIMGGKIYLFGSTCPSISQSLTVQVYHIEKGEWSTLPPAPQYHCKGVDINGKLTLIGGILYSTRNITNFVSTWEESELEVSQGRWIQEMPPMPVAKMKPGLFKHKQYVVIAGGFLDDGSIVDSVEVLNIESQQWSARPALSLPCKVWLPLFEVINGYVYMMNGWESFTIRPVKAFRAPMDVIEAILEDRPLNPLVEIQGIRTFWQPIADPPLKDAALIPGTMPVTVGGSRHGITPAEDNIWMYNSDIDRWCLISHTPQPCMFPACLPVSNDTFLILGGQVDIDDPQKFLNRFDMLTIT